MATDVTHGAADTVVTDTADFPPAVAVMPATPTAIAFTTPAADTVATAGSVDVHVVIHPPAGAGPEAVIDATTAAVSPTTRPSIAGETAMLVTADGTPGPDGGVGVPVDGGAVVSGAAGGVAGGAAGGVTGGVVGDVAGGVALLVSGGVVLGGVVDPPPGVVVPVLCGPVMLGAPSPLPPHEALSENMATTSAEPTRRLRRVRRSGRDLLVMPERRIGGRQERLSGREERQPCSPKLPTQDGGATGGLHRPRGISLRRCARAAYAERRCFS